MAVSPRHAAALASPAKPPAALSPLGGATRFVLGPDTLVGAAGLLHPGDPTVAVPAVDWRQALVDVVIPACRDQATIVLCLAALRAQTLKPRRIVLVDDCSGERDGTRVLAREFAHANGFALDVVEQLAPGGRMATLCEQAARLEGDVMVVVDAHVVLDSPDYLEQCVRGLYQGSGVAAVCGTLLPLRDRDRRRWAMSDAVRRWLGGDAWRDPLQAVGVWQRIGGWLADTSHECSGLVHQRFVQRGQMRAFGSVCHPNGAVAYRRRYLDALLQRYRAEDAHLHAAGHEDVFIGFALANEGFRTVHLPGPLARTQLPAGVGALPRLRARYSASLLRTGSRFRALLRPPSAAPSDWWSHGARHEQRRLLEPYRQAFGGLRTREHGRPVGWAFACSLLDKVAVPLAVIGLLVAGLWSWLAWMAVIETALWLLVLGAVAPAARGRTMLKGLLVAPLRYLDLAADLAGALTFARSHGKRASGR